VICGLLTLLGATDSASAGPGGAFASDPARITAVRCVAGCAGVDSAAAGSVLRVRGRAMREVAKIVFLGGPGDGDNATAPAAHQRNESVDVVVPAKAVSGRLRAVNGDGARSAASRATVALVRLADNVLVASWPLGPLVPGIVRTVTWDGAVAGLPQPTGRYEFRVFGDAAGRRPRRPRQAQPARPARRQLLVINGAGTDVDYAYMHLRRPSPLQKGQAVGTGEPIGEVGDTGDADGCHLHFEMWSGPGWYTGGAPLDPLPYLQAWDAYS
jgi:hypothetical protein